MLELLGFIALIAIIFGVSMTAAVGIIVKAVLWIIGVCIAFAIVGKMQASTAKTLAWIAVIAGVILLAGLDAFQNTTYAPCWKLTNIETFGVGPYEICMSEAAKTVEARTSTAIWLIIIGIVLFIASWVKGDKNNSVQNNQTSRKIDPKEQVTLSPKPQPVRTSEEEEIRLIKEVDIPTQRIMSWISLIYCSLYALISGALLFLRANSIIPDTEDTQNIITTIVGGGALFFLGLLPMGIYFAVRYRQSKKKIALYEYGGIMKKTKNKNKEARNGRHA